MLEVVKSGALIGLKARELNIETDSSLGLPGIKVVGLPDKAVREATERIRSAITNSGYKLAPRKITINLAPADIQKTGPLYDLPMAVGVILALGLSERRAEFTGIWIIGELSLTGKVKPVRGALPLSLSAAAHKKRVIVPWRNAIEAAGSNTDVIPVRNLNETLEFLAGRKVIAPQPRPEVPVQKKTGLDYCQVKGQLQAKRAIEVAAAGRHNILMVGPPGSGKTMLAERLSSIMPPMTFNEAVEVTKIQSLSSGTGKIDGLIWDRPFRAPHHTISIAGLVGGGKPAGPGEISLSHQGILFLDEMAEFGPRALQALRQPLESGEITVVRAVGPVTFPAAFMLVGAMNPCPCGYLGDKERECRCSESRIRSYRSRLSGPLLDRIDLHIDVPRLSAKEIVSAGEYESSTAVRGRVIEARQAQTARLGCAQRANSRMTAEEIEKHCALSRESRALLEQALKRLALGARAGVRIIKVARTIADLAGADAIETEHIAEAVQYRYREII